MPTLQDLAAELTGQIPGLPFAFAKNYVNKALRDVRREKLWSWDIRNGLMITPKNITTGSVTVTQFSSTVTFDATAKTALDAVVLAIPALTKRQFRVGQGPLYNILTYDTGTGSATLDRIYTEDSKTGATYAVYKAYYQPVDDTGLPITDFKRFLSIEDPINGYTISGRRLYMTQEEVRQRDPLRGAQGLPYYVANYVPDSNGVQQYELWPHPTSQIGLLIQYQRFHTDLTLSQSLPTQCDPNLVYFRALIYGSRWGAQNSGRINSLKGVDWRFLLVEAQKEYIQHLVQAKKVDNEIIVRIIKPGGAGLIDYLGPADSNWMQSHGVPAWE